MDDLFERHLEPLVYLEGQGPEIKITAELPGVKKEDIEIEVTERMVEIKANLSKKHRFKRWGTIHRELEFECFHRHIPLPEPILTEKTKASFNRGLLEITLPKKHEKRKVKIE